MKQFYQECKKTIQINAIKGVTVENLALGEFTQDVLIDSAGGGVIDSNSSAHNTSEIIRCVRFDEYVQQHNLKIGLIKIDTEGYEQVFLKGAVQTITSQKPILIISVYHNYSDFYSIKPWLESLNLGYTFHYFKGIDEARYPLFDIMLIAQCRS